jgi:hypothetical protein
LVQLSDAPVARQADALARRSRDACTLLRNAWTESPMLQSVQRIENSGKLVTLSDNSKWLVDSVGAMKARFWSVGDSIEVGTTTLTNERSSDKVSARKK